MEPITVKKKIERYDDIPLKRGMRVQWKGCGSPRGTVVVGGDGTAYGKWGILWDNSSGGGCSHTVTFYDKQEWWSKFEVVK